MKVKNLKNYHHEGTKNTKFYLFVFFVVNKRFLIACSSTSAFHFLNIGNNL
jgi:hypothetical protein